MKEISTNQVIDLLIRKEVDISNKFHNAILEILRLGYETDRGKEQIPVLIESVIYSLEEIKTILNV